MNNAFTIVYAIIALLEISAEFFAGSAQLVGGEPLIDANLLRYTTKPLLMPVLIGIFMLSVDKNFKLKNTFVIALLFSCLGDVALMFVPQNENFFLLGLAAFLITHILYIIAFVKIGNKAGFVKRTPLALTPLIIYFVALIAWLYPHLISDLKIPVVVYALTIALMVVFALNNYRSIPDKAFWNHLMGATLFVLSDSLIAINAFIQPIAFAGVFIMILYVAGQYLITKGFVVFSKKA